jgi:hydroxyacylglutathione hydrolase
MEIEIIPVSPFAQNCSVLRSGGEVIVIDPGEVTARLRNAIAGQHVTMVFNTHGHIDHAAGNAEMVRLTGAPLVCHATELPILQSLPWQGQMFGLHSEPSPEPDRFVAEGDTIHVSLLGDGFIIGGDCLFAGSIGRTDLPGGDYPTLMQTLRDKFLTLPDNTIVYSGHGPTTTIGRERATNTFLQDLQ